jgi:SAM-dependent methyltransferase
MRWRIQTKMGGLPEVDNPSFTGLDALMYDEEVPDWPGEIDFYRKLALETKERGQAVLEIACGTGRVAARLAEAGVQVTGQDLSDDMLDIDARKRRGWKTLVGCKAICGPSTCTSPLA